MVACVPVMARTARHAARLAAMLVLIIAWPVAATGQLQDATSTEAEPGEQVSATTLPARVLRWRAQAIALGHGDGVPRDEALAAHHYCRAARHGDPVAQYHLAWMLTNARGIPRDDAAAAHLFAAAAEQGLVQAANMAQRLGTPRGEPPSCLQPPEDDTLPEATAAAVSPAPAGAAAASGVAVDAPAHIARFVQLVAPEYRLDPALVLAVMAVESAFDPWAVSPKGALGLMQLIPDTARRFDVRNPMDPTENMRGGMAYLRWLLAHFEGDLVFTLAAYNAGERAVERYRGVPPYAETRAYVRRVMARLGGRRLHPFDPDAAPPSALAQAVRRAMPR